MKCCYRGRRDGVLFIKANAKVIKVVRKSSVNNVSTLRRRHVVGDDLQTLPDVPGVVGGEILLQLVTVLGLGGLDGLLRCTPRLPAFVLVVSFVSVLFRL